MYNKRILLTGADGFIGSHLAEALVRSGYNVRAFVYEHGGKRVVAYWHVSDKARLVFANPLGGIASLDAADMKLFETDLSEEAVRAAFAGATIQ